MSRFVFAFTLLTALIANAFSASAGERHHRKIHHRHHHIGVSVGVTFHAYVQVRPQIIVDRPKLVRPVHYRKVRVVKPVRGCSVKQASAIARDHGIRYQTIVRTPHTMTVYGYRQGKKAKICLSRAPGCTILD